MSEVKESKDDTIDSTWTIIENEDDSDKDSVIFKPIIDSSWNYALCTLKEDYPEEILIDE